MSTVPSILSGKRSSWLGGLVVGFALALGPADPVSAMEFATTGANGSRVVVAHGPIAAGDAGRLRIALQTADRDSFGHKTLVLDSIGGVVGEAFAMATVMDAERVATVVPAGASCASACAQIVFLAGLHRVVQDGGRIGLHSCRSAKDGTASPYCNDLIARHAVAHGTIYGPIMAFMEMTPAGSVRWLDAHDADCWGLTRWPPGSGRGAKDGALPPCLLKGPVAKASEGDARDKRRYRSVRFDQALAPGRTLPRRGGALYLTAWLPSSPSASSSASPACWRSRAAIRS